MNPPADSAAAGDDGAPTAPRRPTHRCLVVHDDLHLRLKLAELVRSAGDKLDADAITVAALEELPIERLRGYAAVLLIVQFLARTGEDPLALVTRLRSLAPRLPIFIFARGGDERAAARAIKLGASDYWPIHAVDVSELNDALQQCVQRLPASDDPPATRLEPAGLPAIAGYRLLKRLAQSASSALYLARNDKVAQTVALKVQPIEGRGVSDADRQRFAQECEILASLNHRAIADVIDFGITPQYLYLALEYFPCGSLRDRLKNPVSEADAVDYARQIAEALKIVHAAGVVHGDLKPSNLMLTTDNRVVLIDFGSARAQILPHEASRSELTTGTPYYVCPEEIGGKNADARGDLYSLGIVFFELLSGSVPFRGASLSEIFRAHQEARVPPLATQLMRYQPIINRLLAKNPDGRFQDATQFLEALGAVCEASGNPLYATNKKRSA